MPCYTPWDSHLEKGSAAHASALAEMLRKREAARHVAAYYRAAFADMNQAVQMAAHHFACDIEYGRYVALLDVASVEDDKELKEFFLACANAVRSI